MYRGYHDPRHTLRYRPQVALKAAVASVKTRLVRFRHVKRVKDVALLWVKAHDLKYLSTPHITNLHIIAEVECPGITGRDFRGLEAGLRKDQHLRIGIDAEEFQKARQISEAIRIVFELGASIRQLHVKPGNRVI